ncbi:MAG: hypothetical protein A4E32_01794 [Methanomassiliicoccales archaeon PtaU1.Bin124]|nr:MAG: hypothetical protein A4E32_01794 [Methanomassiliicoccales archaeon PtaU1.Bin124]
MKNVNGREKAGLILLLAGIQFALLLIIAETQYPGYNAGTNVISDLGVWGQPSAIIFNPSVFLFGLMAVIAAYLLRNEPGMCRVPLFTAISGIGAMGVGIFPETIHWPHVISAGIAFGVGGIACVHCYRIAKPPLRFVFFGLGALSLISLVLTGAHIDLGLGEGGIERLVAYPIVIWVIMLGVLLLEREDTPAGTCSV